MEPHPHPSIPVVSLMRLQDLPQCHHYYCCLLLLLQAAAVATPVPAPIPSLAATSKTDVAVEGYHDSLLVDATSATEMQGRQTSHPWGL